MKHNQTKINTTGYVQPQEVLEHIRYKIENSKNYIDWHVSEFYPRSVWAFSLLYKLYMLSPEGIFSKTLYRISISLLKRISKKINFEGYNPSIFRERDLGTIAKMVF